MKAIAKKEGSGKSGATMNPVHRQVSYLQSLGREWRRFRSVKSPLDPRMSKGMSKIP